MRRYSGPVTPSAFPLGSRCLGQATHCYSKARLPNSNAVYALRSRACLGAGKESRAGTNDRNRPSGQGQGNEDLAEGGVIALPVGQDEGLRSRRNAREREPTSRSLK